MLSNNNLLEIDGKVYKMEMLIRTFKDFYYHLKQDGLGHDCPNCGKHNYFELNDIRFFAFDKNGSATYKCKNLFCNFSFHIEPLKKESS